MNLENENTWGNYKIPNAVTQIGGIASILAGALMIVGFALHPNGEDATFGTDPLWVPAHGLLWLAFTTALLGWIGVYLFQAHKSGRLGVIAFALIIIGTSLASWIFSSDVTYVPVIAAQSPDLFEKINTNAHVLIGVLSVLAWVVGMVLFGVSVIRARVFSRWAGILLILGTVGVPIAYLTGLPEKVVISGPILAGIGQIWLGYELLRFLKNPATRSQSRLKEVEGNV